MRERGTLRLDTGRVMRVEVVGEDPRRHELVVRETDERTAETPDLLTVIDAHLAAAPRRAAGTTDRLLAADRDRPY